MVPTGEMDWTDSCLYPIPSEVEQHKLPKWKVPGPSCLVWTTLNYTYIGLQTGHPNRMVQVCSTISDLAPILAPSLSLSLPLIRPSACGTEPKAKRLAAMSKSNAVMRRSRREATAQATNARSRMGQMKASVPRPPKTKRRQRVRKRAQGVEPHGVGVKCFLFRVDRLRKSRLKADGFIDG